MKVLTAWFTLLIVSLLALPTFAFAATPAIQLFLDGKSLSPEVAPRIVNGNTIVPIRVIAESLGSKVSWDSKARKVTVEKGDKVIQLFIDKTRAVVGDKEYQLETAPVIVKGTTMVPIRFVSEQLGIKVTWDDLTKSVFLYQQQSEPLSSDLKSIPVSSIEPGDKVSAGQQTDAAKNDGNLSSSTGSNGPTGVAVVQSISLKGDTLTVNSSGGKLKPNVTQLSNPERIVLDFPDAQLESSLQSKVNANGEGWLTDKSEYVSRIRYSLFSKEPSNVRIVLDLPQKSQLNLSDPQQSGSMIGKIVPVKTRFKVVIDPGHGGKDTGAISITNRNEKEFVLSVGQKVAKLLEKEPAIQTIMTRSDDTFIELSDRVAKANEAGADLFVAIHANSSGSDTARGTETYYWTDQSVDFANLIHRYLLEGTGFPDRKVKKSGFYVIKNTTMPSVLLEVGFLSNATDETLMYQDDFQNKIAASIVAAIKKQLNLN